MSTKERLDEATGQVKIYPDRGIYPRIYSGVYIPAGFQIYDYSGSGGSGGDYRYLLLPSGLGIYHQCTDAFCSCTGHRDCSR